MAITPTPHLFTAISAADLARSSGRAPARSYAATAGNAGESTGRNHGEANPAGTGRPQSPPRTGETAESRLETATTETTESESGPTVAAEFRREAVGPSRPQFQRLGQKVDLSV